MRRSVFNGVLVAAVGFGMVLAGSASAAVPAPGQAWRVDAPDFAIRSAVTGACLTGTGPAMPTVLQPCVGAPAQPFVVQGPMIRNLASGLCLTGTGPSRPTVMEPCDGEPAQRFAVQGPIIRNLVSGLCLTAVLPGKVNSPTTMETCQV